MLKITTVDNDSSAILLIVEGRLIGPWIVELERVARRHLAATNPLAIDVSALSFADARGLKLLHRLMERGVALQAASPFLLELLNRNK